MTETSVNDAPQASDAPEGVSPSHFVERARGFFSSDKFPEAVFVFLCIAWGLVFFRLGSLKHQNFQTPDFDLGIFDQASWLVAFFKEPFMTVRGMDIWGHHANFIFYLFAPGYWLGGGPRFLLAVQILSQVAGAVGIYLLARYLMPKQPWMAVLLGSVLLLHHSSQWLVHEFFHPDAFAIGPLILAYWAARTKHWRWYWAMFVLALLCKEDVAIALFIMGLLIAWRGERKKGFTSAGIALGWYVFVTKILIPWRLHGAGTFYGDFFGDLGSDPISVMWSLIRHPSKAWEIFTDEERRTYYWELWAPFAFLPFLAPEVLLIGIPMVVINSLGIYVWIHDAHTHYVAVPLAASMLATVELLARTKSESVRMFFAGTLVIASITTSVIWGIAPYSTQYKKGAWPFGDHPRTPIMQHGVELVPKNASVTATYNIVPHVTHRQYVYSFPNPWRPSNWGLHDENTRDPNSIDWLLIDQNTFGQQKDFDLLNCLLKTEFTKVYEKDNLVVAKRTSRPAYGQPCVNNS